MKNEITIYHIISGGIDAEKADYPNWESKGCYLSLEKARKELDGFIALKKAGLDDRYDMEHREDDLWEMFGGGNFSRLFTRMEIVPAVLHREEGPLSEEADGSGLTMKQFVKCVQTALPRSTKAAVLCWVSFGVECVEMRHYVGFHPISEKFDEVQRWLEAISNGLCRVKEKYGEGIATTICELGGQGKCLYPWEMDDAAQYISDHGGVFNWDEFLDRN